MQKQLNELANNSREFIIINLTVRKNKNNVNKTVFGIYLCDS